MIVDNRNALMNGVFLFPRSFGNDWDIVAYDNVSLYRSYELTFKPSGIVTQHAVLAYELVLKYAGAVIPFHDSVDKRVIQSVRNRSGTIIDSQDDVGGWPKFKKNNYN